ncbi:hypothetical protein EZS27_015278 [termite gut metagenome]|uniref:Winged helix-turn helix domain-containing protein n=1 Tax=termite gut metagenome TaxID=433724 RepID=A0A5J4RRP4_9ZZZZ
MKHFKVFPHLSIEELLSVLNSQKEIRAFKDWQIIYYVWDLFKRHNRKKKVPRGSHPKSNEGARQEYKKNLRS